MTVSTAAAGNGGSVACKKGDDGQGAARGAEAEEEEMMQQICLTYDVERERAQTRHNSIYWQRDTPGQGRCCNDAFQDHSIKFVLSILEEDAPGPICASGVSCWRSPSVGEGEDQAALDSLDEVLSEVHKRIDDALAGGGSVLVHCSGSGVRSSTAVISYTMKRLGIGRNQALQRVNACATLAELTAGCWDLLGQKETEYLSSWTADFLPTLDPMDPPARRLSTIQSMGGKDPDADDSASEASLSSADQ
jgi:hypothetical protein